MCMEDERISRSLDTQIRTFTGPTALQVLGVNKNRRSVVFSYLPTVAGTVIFSPQVDGAVAAVPAVTLTQQNPTFVATRQIFGSLLKNPWLATDSTGAAVVTITETSLDAQAASDLR